MALDPSILLGGQQPQIQNPLDMAQKAQSLKSMVLQNQALEKQTGEQVAMSDILKRNTVADASGNLSINRQSALSDMYKVNPQKAMEFQKQLQSQDLDTLKNHTAVAKDLSFSATPENWSQIRAKAQQLGLQNADKLPEQYTPDFVQRWQVATLSGEEQVKKMESDRTFQQKERELGLKHEENAIKRGQMLTEKDDKMAKDLDKHLSGGWASRSGQAGKVQGKINAAEYAEGLIEQGKGQKNGLDSRQIEELAQSTSLLLGGGAQASARIEALVPHTLLGRAQSLKEWLTNNPTGSGQEEFVKRMAETVAREKQISADQMKQFQIEGLPAHSRLKQSNPKLYNSLLESKGIDPKMIDEKGRYKKKPEQPPAGTYDHLSDDQLLEMYKKAGGN